MGSKEHVRDLLAGTGLEFEFERELVVLARPRRRRHRPIEHRLARPRTFRGAAALARGCVPRGRERREQANPFTGSYVSEYRTANTPRGSHLPRRLTAGLDRGGVTDEPEF